MKYVYLSIYSLFFFQSEISRDLHFYWYFKTLNPEFQKSAGLKLELQEAKNKNHRQKKADWENFKASKLCRAKPLQSYFLSDFSEIVCFDFEIQMMLCTSHYFAKKLWNSPRDSSQITFAGLCGW